VITRPRHRHRGTLALDAEGRFLALRMDVLADMERFSVQRVHSCDQQLCPLSVERLRHTAYRRAGSLRVHQHDADAPYRGAGRPEANYAIERLVEVASTVTGIDSLTLRVAI